MVIASFEVRIALDGNARDEDDSKRMAEIEDGCAGCTHERKDRTERTEGRRESSGGWGGRSSDTPNGEGEGGASDALVAVDEKPPTVDTSMLCCWGWRYDDGKRVSVNGEKQTTAARHGARAARGPRRHDAETSKAGSYPARAGGWVRTDAVTVLTGIFWR